MSAKTPAASAGKLIAAKADRILSRLDSSARGADEQRRHASALLHLATQVSADSSYAARALDDAHKINEKDREIAGEMVSRRAQSAEGNQNLEDAIALYGIALSIHDNSDWQVLRGFAQVQTLDFAGAKASFEAVQGYHAEGAAYRAKLCGLQLKGVDLSTMATPGNPDQAHILKNFLFHMKGGHNSPEYKERREREVRERIEHDAAAARPPSPRIPLNRGEVGARFIDKVAQAIAAKADRTLAGIKSSDRKADEKQRHASALLMLASEVSGDESFGARAPVKTAAITDHDRERAATEANSLASRAEGAGKSRDAIAYYDIALSLHYEGYWVYLKGLLQQRLEEYAAAVQTFGSVQGTYAQYAAPLAEQCRQQMGEKPAADAGFDQLMSWMKNAGGDKAADALRMFGDAINAAAALQPDDNDDDEPDDADSESELTPQKQWDLELASNTAQEFAEHLVRGDFAVADAMLTKAAQPAGGAEDLRASYLDMTQREDDGTAPDDAEVMVMSSNQVHEEHRENGDLGWVYVAITGEDFNEAVTVIVTRVNGQPRIRNIEWGRP